MSIKGGRHFLRFAESSDRMYCSEAVPHFLVAIEGALDHRRFDDRGANRVDANTLVRLMSITWRQTDSWSSPVERN